MKRLVIENFRRLNFCRVYFIPSKLTTSVPKDAIKFIMYDGWYIDWGTMRYYGISQEPTISVTLGNAAERQSIVLGKDHYFWEGEGWEGGQFPTAEKPAQKKGT